MTTLLLQLPPSNSTRSEQSLMDEFMAVSNSDPSQMVRLQHKPPTHSCDTGDNKSGSPVAQTLAVVLIARLQAWCRQLLWLTIVCVIRCCGDSVDDRARHKTIRHMRRSIRNQSSNTRMKSIAAIEMQMLRHLTESERSVSRKRRGASRPPSPQLYDISEEAELDW